MDNPRSDFYTLAAKARSIGLLSQAEIDLLRMKGTRKSEYWARHLRNLKDYTKDKIRKLPSPLMYAVPFSHVLISGSWMSLPYFCENLAAAASIVALV